MSCSAADTSPNGATRVRAEWVSVLLPSVLVPWPIAVAGGVVLLGFYVLEQLLLAKTASHGMNFRGEANPGTWCTVLVVLVVLQSLPESSSALHQHLYVQTCTLSVLSVMFLSVFVKNDQPVYSPLPIKFLGGVIMLSSVIASNMLQLDLITCLLISVPTQSLFYWLLITIPSACPKSFTLGECLVLSQAIALFTFYSVADLIQACSHLEDVAPMHKQATRFAEVALLGCELAVFLWMKFPSLRSPFGFYFVGGNIAVLLILPCMHAVLNKNPFLWFLNYITASYSRGFLLSFWLALSSITVISSILYGGTAVEASTVQRKLFHGVILLIYLPALIVDPEFLRLCSMVTLGLFVIAECIRIMRIPPVGKMLHQSLQGFLDEKDQGLVIVSHIYLLVGCSFPLWLNPVTDNSVTHSISLSGLLSVGIGDAVASIAGTAFGRHPLPGTKKTLEGTLMSMASQLLTSLILLKSGKFVWPSNLFVPLVAVASCSLLEAFTLQIDNIIVPLLMYVAWSIP